MPGPLYPLQPVFARGELSPRLFSRVDIDHYKMGLAECVNWLVMKQGGLRRRPGTEWINYIKESATRSGWSASCSRPCRRMCWSLAITTSASTPTAAWSTKAPSSASTSITPNVVNWDAHGLVVNDPVQFSTDRASAGAAGDGHDLLRQDRCRRRRLHDFSNAGRRGDQPGRPPATAPTAGCLAIELATPYSIDDIWKLQFAQSRRMCSTSRIPISSK